jgi:hypothetical protein
MPKLDRPTDADSDLRLAQHDAELLARAGHRNAGLARLLAGLIDAMVDQQLGWAGAREQAHSWSQAVQAFRCRYPLE